MAKSIFQELLKNMNIHYLSLLIMFLSRGIHFYPRIPLDGRIMVKL